MDIRGYCPACGRASLYVVKTHEEGEGFGRGYLECREPECPERSATDKILSESLIEHTVYFGPHSFTIRHPLRERLGDALLNCPLYEQVMILRPPVQGVYRAYRKDGNSDRWIFERM